MAIQNWVRDENGDPARFKHYRLRLCSLSLSFSPAPLGSFRCRSNQSIGVPGNGIQAAPTLYLTLFATPSVMVEPQLVFQHFSYSNGSTTSIAVAGQVGHLFTPSRPGSAYLAANGAFISASTSNAGPFGSSLSRSGPGLGAALGYRFKLKTKMGAALALRLDARYRRWFSDFKNLSEYGVGIGLGGLF